VDKKKCECWIDDWFAVQDKDGNVETLRCAKCGKDLLAQSKLQWQKELREQLLAKVKNSRIYDGDAKFILLDDVIKTIKEK